MCNKLLMIKDILKGPGLIAMVVLFALPLQASHIVGGEITYRCLGDNNYEISMTLYRDCFYGVPYFDQPAFIGFFNQDNERVQEVGENGMLRMHVRNDDTLSPVLENPCYVIPPDVCVHTTTYLDTINLPFLEGGYTLVYQRCCRNQTILNILDPDGTGGTYVGFISATALLDCNSSATFNEWPPFFICVNQPIDFDHAATDIEGDSLVYKLCNPLGGDYRTNPRPVPPFPPPYDTVEWVSPPYSLENKLGGSDPLRIDPETGFLTGTPPTIGQFVVGVCVEEYRDGEFINEVRRDFQFNVGVCGVTTAAFFSADIYCNQLTVEFENLSDNPLGIKWIFGDPENPIDTSSEFDPVFTFPDFGEYQVTLIAQGITETCTDTFTKTIELLDVDFEVDVSVDRIRCADTLEVEFSPLLITSVGGSNSFYWEVSWNDQKRFSSDSSILVSVFGTDSVEVFLRVINDELGCWKTFRFMYATGLLPESGDEFTIDICKGESINLYPDFNESRTFMWEPITGLIDPPDTPNPLAAPVDSITYIALVSDGECTASVKVHVNVEETIAEFYPFDNFCNSLQIGFIDQSINSTGSLWIVGDISNPFDTSNEENPVLSFPDTGEFEVTLIALGALEICNDTITKIVEVFDTGIELDVLIDRGPCGDSIQLDFSAAITSLSPDGHFFNWKLTVGDSILTSVDSTISLQVADERSIRVQFEYFNEDLNCTSVYDFNYETGLILEDGLQFSYLLCEDETVELFPGFYEGNTYLWSPEKGLLDPPDTPNPKAKPDEYTIYTAEITNQNCIGNIEVEVGVVRSDLFSLPDTVCGTLEVRFINPFLANGNRGLWQFFKDGSLLGSRISDTLDFTFSSFGDWTVLFRPIGIIPIGCPDTLIKPMFLFDLDLDLELEIERGDCIDSLELFLTAITGKSIPGSHEYLWIINQDTFSTTDSSFTAYVHQGDSAFIEVVLRNDFGCQFAVFDSLFTGLIEEDFRADSILICPGDSIFLNPGFPDDYSYQWSPTSFMQTPDTISNPLVTPLDAIRYTGMVSNDWCSVNYTIDVFVFDPVIELDEIILCGELNFEIEAPQIDGADYHWILGSPDIPIDSGNMPVFQIALPDFGSYVVSLIISAPGLSCADTFRTIITAIEVEALEPNIELQRGACSDSLELTLISGVADSLTGGLEFEWIVTGDTAIFGQGDSLEVVLKNVFEIEIELIVTDSFGCTVRDTLVYQTGLIPEVFERDTIEICLGDTTFLNPGYIPEYDYTWSPSFGMIDLLTDPNPRVSPASTTLYVAEVQFGDCVQLKEVFVIVNPPPTITGISANPNPVPLPISTLLTVDFLPPSADVSWSPPDLLDSPFSPNPIATIDQPTVFTVEITSEDGCISVDSILVETLQLPCEDPYVFLPNAFSPNGDGQNDILFLRGEHIERFELIIYNRWGQMVFRSDDLELGWDGTFNGEEAPLGAYGYHLEVECIGGLRFSRKGNVNLIR
ncbi:MAG: hypothetical protein EA409_07795 [Saprospirales bacterium]|nr:MAG: hypothetical protein EA409_07795 [Saprospirales bacterium]